MSQPPSGGPSTELLYFLSVIASGSLLTLMYQLYLRRKRGAAEDDELVSRITNQVAQGAHALLDEYRIALEAAKQQIELYLKQVTELNRLLGEANGRISALEDRLRDGEGDRKELRQQLREATRRRDTVLKEMEELRRRIAELERENRIEHHGEERATPRVPPSPPSGPD